MQYLVSPTTEVSVTRRCVSRIPGLLQVAMALGLITHFCRPEVESKPTAMPKQIAGIDCEIRMMLCEVCHGSVAITGPGIAPGHPLVRISCCSAA